MKILLFITSLIVALSTQAQVTVNKSISFINSDSTKRQVVGYGSAKYTHNAVSAKDVIIDRLKTSTSVSYSSGLITMNSAIDLSNYAIGMEITFKANFSCNDSTFISINNHGPKLITKDYTLALDSADIDSGMMISLIYDGTNFQLINSLKKCPSGFVAVDNNYCIEIDERPADNIWNAILTCDLMGGNICSISEWHYACQNTSLGLVNTQNNWEWVDHGNDHGTGGTIVGGGATGCSSQKSTNVDVTQNGSVNNYRCCFYR